MRDQRRVRDGGTNTTASTTAAATPPPPLPPLPPTTTTAATTDGLALRAFENAVAPATRNRARNENSRPNCASVLSLSPVENRALFFSFSYSLLLPRSFLSSLAAPPRLSRLDRADHNCRELLPMSSSVTARGTAPHSSFTPPSRSRQSARSRCSRTTSLDSRDMWILAEFFSSTRRARFEFEFELNRSSAKLSLHDIRLYFNFGRFRLTFNLCPFLPRY